jgi:hypothetical protein
VLAKSECVSAPYLNNGTSSARQPPSYSRFYMRAAFCTFQVSLSYACSWQFFAIISGQAAAYCQQFQFRRTSRAHQRDESLFTPALSRRFSFFPIIPAAARPAFQGINNTLGAVISLFFQCARHRERDSLSSHIHGLAAHIHQRRASRYCNPSSCSSGTPPSKMHFGRQPA